MNAKQQRNELCSCGSGKKYKKCCGLKEAKEAATRSSLLKGIRGTEADMYKDLTKSLFKVIKSGMPGMPTVPKADVSMLMPEEIPDLMPPTDEKKS